MVRADISALTWGVSSIMRNFIVLALLMLSFKVMAASLQVAITIDDLPQHGDLPPGVSRLDIAKKNVINIR